MAVLGGEKLYGEESVAGEYLTFSREDVWIVGDVVGLVKRWNPFSDVLN